MSFDKTFAGAYIDGGLVHRVLGKKLRPFSPWHLYQLQIVESPFLEAGNVFLGHLRRAVGICRLLFPCSRTRLPILPLVVTQKILEIEVGKFLTYVDSYLQRPEYTILQPDAFSRSLPLRVPANAPDCIQLAFDAAHGANIPLTDAWNLPIGQAYIAQAMQMRRQGLMVDFMTEKEREFQNQLKERLRERRNGEEHARKSTSS